MREGSSGWVCRGASNFQLHACITSAQVRQGASVMHARCPCLSFFRSSTISFTAALTCSVSWHHEHGSFHVHDLTCCCLFDCLRLLWGRAERCSVHAPLIIRAGQKVGKGRHICAMLPVRRLLAAAAGTRTHLRLRGLRACIISASLAGKGFGDSNRGGESDERQRKTPKGKMKNIKRSDAPIPGQLGSAQGLQNSPALNPAMLLAEEQQSKEEEAEFAKRLAVVKLEGQEKKSSLPYATAGSSNVAAFDGPSATLDYSRPPSIGDTLMGQLNADVSDPSLKNAQIGPNQVTCVSIFEQIKGALYLFTMLVRFGSPSRLCCSWSCSSLSAEATLQRASGTRAYVPLRRRQTESRQR